MTTALATLYHTVADAIRPDPIMLVSEWAADRLELPESSPEKGRWKKDKAPYIIEPMDCLSRQNPCELLVAMIASQMGKTQCLLLAPIGHHVDTSPRPMLYVQPTIETAEEHSKERVQAMFDDCPTLAAKVPKSVSRDGKNTLKLKRFPGGFLKFAGANSAASLASTPIGDAFCDEIDRWPEDCDGEGDPVGLVRARLTNFRAAKLVLVSTPTETDHSRIEAAYQTTDQCERWVPCPHCGEWQLLHWREEDGPRKGEYRLIWDKDHPETAHYVCEHNGCVIEERHKAWMDAHGEWRAKHPEKARGGKVRGFRLNCFLSPWFSWEKLAAEWEEIDGDPVKLRTFFNTRMSLTFSMQVGAAVKAEGLLGRREPYRVAPAGVRAVTAGVDVQHDRLELHLTGWGHKWESWALDHVVLPGSPTGESVWEALDVHLARRIPTADGRTLIIAGTCVDAGDGNSSDRVIRWCADRHEQHVWATKGSSISSSPIWPQKPTKWKGDKKKKARSLPLYVIGVHSAKRDIMDRLARDGRTNPGPGAMHFPERWPSGLECDHGYFEQLTCEKLVRKRGKSRWEKRHEGARNEVLDCTVYAYAALHALIRLGLSSPDDWTRVEVATAAATPSGPEPAPAPVSTGPEAERTSQPAAPPPKTPPKPRPLVRRPAPARSQPRSRSIW